MLAERERTDFPKAEQETRTLLAARKLGVVARDAHTLEVTLVSPRKPFSFPTLANVYTFFPAPHALLEGKSESELSRYFNEPREGNPRVVGTYEGYLLGLPGPEPSPQEESVWAQCGRAGLRAPGAGGFGAGPLRPLPNRLPADGRPGDLGAGGAGQAQSPTALHLLRGNECGEDGPSAAPGDSLCRGQVPALCRSLAGPPVGHEFAASGPPRRSRPGCVVAVAGPGPRAGALVDVRVPGRRADLDGVGHRDLPAGNGHRGCAQASAGPTGNPGFHSVTSRNLGADVRAPDGSIRPHLHLRRIGADYAHPQTFFTLFGPGGKHYTQWQTLEGGRLQRDFEALMGKGASALTAEDASVAYGAAQRLLQNEAAVVVPLFILTGTSVADPGWRGSRSARSTSSPSLHCAGCRGLGNEEARPPRTPRPERDSAHRLSRLPTGGAPPDPAGHRIQTGIPRFRLKATRGRPGPALTVGLPAPVAEALSW